ncbi:MAG: CHAT domain-containing protein [Caldilinea sp.]|nr:CHAT domain-containing protein [Caldilinea sp.]MDW8440244.1 CHAT domain-containing protein [Caldilineaceae bacterium]
MALSLVEALPLAGLAVAEALAQLQLSGRLQPETAGELARHSVEIAADDLPNASRLLELAQAVHRETGADATVTPWLHYAQARLNVLDGDLNGAETNLMAARTAWNALGDPLLQARSSLGLTQVLTMQGRFAEAEPVIRTAIQTLTALPVNERAVRLTLFAARQNLATLLSYQERHREAMETLNALRAEVASMLAAGVDADLRLQLTTLLGEIGVDLAICYSYLDRPEEAIAVLRSAIEQLTDAEAYIERGRAYTNLGHLYSRTGRWADALAAFEAAMNDLVGEAGSEEQPERWRLTDVLFLEQGLAHLSLNLLPEAAADLAHAAALFEQNGKLYELAQTQYYRGLLALREGDADATRIALSAAAELFTRLANRYWLNRVHIAQAHAALLEGAEAEAATLLGALLREASLPASEQTLTWDLLARCEAALLSCRLALRSGEIAAAGEQLARAEQWLTDVAAGVEPALLYPQITLQILHARGLLARGEGDLVTARRFFQQAVETVERQRALLPLEEFRTAFLDDKTVLYADLTLALLDDPAPTEQTLADAFAVIERARARVLLERLLSAVETHAVSRQDMAAERSAAIRQQLTWLYNQLLSDHPDSRGVSQRLSETVRQYEAALERIERRLASGLIEVEPEPLIALQSVLEPSEQALIYYKAGDEWMAFMVDRQSAQLVRRLCRHASLEAALAELRFQLGRAEIGVEYLARHSERLLRGAHAALRRVYTLIVAPLVPSLTAKRLLIIPYGDLHMTPFHALWDGERYLLERFEVRYAPGASIEVRRRRRNQIDGFRSLAGFALREPSIPQAEMELQAAARFFQDAQVFIDAQATLEQVQDAAAYDVLHFATHGLFRADNPFFSALKLADGWLDVRMIYRLPLRAKLVVLSACQSGAVRVQGTDEAIGLVRGFLGAGVPSLIVSLWNVHDASAMEVMTDFYRSLTERRLTPSAALRSAQRIAIEAQRHPYYWAPYVAIG